MTLLTAIARPHRRVSRPVTYSALVLGDSPVGYWKADEASGTTMFDYSGNGYHATYSGSAILGQPALRSGSAGCVQITATGVYAAHVAVGTNLVIGASDAFTLEAVVRKTGGTGTYAPIFGYNDTFPEQPGVVYRYGASNSDITGKPAGAGAEAISPNATSGTVVMLQFVYTPGSVNGTGKIYENGALVVSATVTASSPSNNGSNIAFLSCTNSSFPFFGFGSDFAIYKYALSAAQCLAHAHQAGLA